MLLLFILSLLLLVHNLAHWACTAVVMTTRGRCSAVVRGLSRQHETEARRSEQFCAHAFSQLLL